MAKALPAKLSTRALTRHLHELGAEAHTVADDGTILTREEALARLLWDKALGWEEVTRDEDGNVKRIKHKPESWAIQYIYERREGKAAAATVEEDNRIRTSERVRELARDRLNRLAEAAVNADGSSGKSAKGPPKYNPNRDAE